MKYKDISTPQLVEKCVQKDAIAWAEFVTRFSEFIRFSIEKTLSTCLNNKPYEDIKDIQQNLLMSLWNGDKLATVSDRQNINYWLAVVARNAAINHLRAGRKEVLIGDEKYFERLPAEGNTQKLAVIDNNSLDKKIKEIYSTLTSREKLIFKLYFKKRIATEDISRIMHVPRGSVSSIVFRIKQKIKCNGFEL